MSSKVAMLRELGATFTWGANKQGTRRHAYPDRCFAGCPTSAHHKRTHLPASLCGNAWGPGWPIPDDPSLLSCRACQRQLIGGWP